MFSEATLIFLILGTLVVLDVGFYLLLPPRDARKMVRVRGRARAPFERR